MPWSAATSIVLLLAATSQEGLAVVAAPAANTEEVKFTTNAAGTDFYYLPSSGQISPDGKTGQVRVRIVYSRRGPKLFEREAASATGFFVFDCVRRTYLVDAREFFDEAGRLMPKREYPIVVGIPDQPVTEQIQAVYTVACTKSAD